MTLRVLHIRPRNAIFEQPKHQIDGIALTWHPIIYFGFHLWRTNYVVEGFHRLKKLWNLKKLSKNNHHSVESALVFKIVAVRKKNLRFMVISCPQIKDPNYFRMYSTSSTIHPLSFISLRRIGPLIFWTHLPFWRFYLWNMVLESFYCFLR